MSHFVVFAEYTGTWMPDLIQGIFVTIELTILCLLVSLTLGLLIALARGSRARPVQMAAITCIETVRGVPALALLYLVYFGLPSMAILVPSFWAAVVALGLYGAVYMAEIYRSGIEAIDKGQVEAGLAIGMGHLRVMQLIVLPQSVRIILPATTNLAIGVLRDTALALTIASPELMYQAQALVAEYYRPMEIYILATIVYLIVTLPMVRIVRVLESYAGRGRATGTARPKGDARPVILVLEDLA